MAEIRRATLFGKLNTLAYQALERATESCKSKGNPYLELAHWIDQILQLPDSDLRRIVRHFDLDRLRMGRDIAAALDSLPRTASDVRDLSPDLENAVERGWVYATLMFGSSSVRTGTLLVGLLKTPSLRNTLLQVSPLWSAIDVDLLTDQFPSITGGSPEDALSTQESSVRRDSTRSRRDIFICYRRMDSLHATGRIFDRLSVEFGEDRVFKDVNSIPAGVKDFAEETQQQLNSAKVMLVIVGDSWLTVRNDSTGRRRLDEEDDFVRIELKWGLDRQEVSVIPVLLDSAELPTAPSLPAALRQFARCQAMRVRSDPEFNRDVQNLIAGVHASLRRGAASSAD